MKRTLSRIAISILTLVVIAYGVNPPLVQAASLTASLTSGTVGSAVSVSGTAFTANETGITVNWDSTVVASGLRADGTGAWTTTFVVPASPSGSHNIAATGPVSSASITFSVVPGITLSQTSGAPGTSVTATGTGFAASETGIAVTYDGIGVVPGISASAQGGWTATFTIPASNAGSHSITAYGAITSTSSVRTIVFTVTAAVSINKSGGAPGSSVTVTGSGFGTNETGITVTYDGAPVATGIGANSQGGWTQTIIVPPSPAGSHVIHAYGSTTLASSTSDVVFIVGAGIATSDSSGSPGTSITITGSGFGASETGITVSWDTTTVASGIRANATGAWTANFIVPPAPAGAHLVRANGSTTTSVPDVSFTVTAGITTSVASGSPGSSITVNGSGFAANETGITITYDGSTVASSIRANAGGAWTATFLIPASTSGSHAIHASGATTLAAATSDVIFNVVPGASPSQTAGAPGSTITVTGTGFAPNETGISITYDGANVASGIRANATGSWTANVAIPPSASGPHTFHTAGSISLATTTPDVTFTVNPIISINQESGAPGSSVTVTGAGFAANETGITVTYDNTTVATGIRANATGSWTANFTIPPSAAGSHTISVRGAVTQAGAVSQISYTSTPSVTISPVTGYVGSTVQISGSGFAVNSAIKLTYDDKDVSPQGGTTDATGSFSVSITVPVSKGGAHSITAVDAQKNQIKATFNMDTTPPPVPTLSSPDDGSRVSLLGNSKPTLSWSNVTDPSGVAYELQIDISPDFSQPILDKNVPGNRYTLTASEALPLGDYYWRVRAIDQASNQSAWSQSRLLKSGAMSLGTLVIIILVFLAVAAAAAYIILVRLPRRRRQLAGVPEGAAPRVVVTGQWRSIEQAAEEAPRERPMPLRLALPQPEKGKKILSNEDQARLKVIVDFAQSLPLVEPGYTTSWLLDLLESGTGIEASAPIYEQLLKSELQVRYEPAWTHHPTYQDLTSLLAGQPVLQDLNAFVDAVNRCASDATSLLQEIYRDTISDIPTGLLEKGGWAFISGVYADAISWFLGKSLRDPSEREYSIKPPEGSEEDEGLWLSGQANTPFAGPLIQAADEKEALRYRGLHLKLRRSYRNNNKAKDFVSMMTQLDVQRSRLLNVFSQFGRLKQ